MVKKRVTGLNRIKAVIKSQGRTELWVAQQLGISKTSLSNYCSFIREPSLELLFRIAKVLQVPVCDLINQEADIEPKTAKKRGRKVANQPE
jgi:transcriptional regulator with XRE-family HTH domain